MDDRPATPDGDDAAAKDPDEVARLRDEVTRLEGANAALRRRVSLRGALRRGSRAALLVLGCLLALLSAFAIWTRVVLLDTDRYVSTVAPLAERPDIQRGLTNRISDRIFDAVDVEAYARDLLPPRAQPLAAPLAGAVESTVRREIGDFVASERFTTLWDQANRRAHALLIQLLTGEEVRNLRLEGDTVVLDLAGVIDTLKQRLSDRGLGGLASRIPDSAGRDIPLVQSSAIESAQTAVRVIKAIAILLPLLSLLAFAGYVLLSGDRRRALLRAALALALTMVVLLGLVGLARSAYLDALDDRTVTRATAADVYDTLLRFLKDGIRVTVAAAVVVALIAALFGRPLDRVAASGAVARVRESTWVRDHRVGLQIAVAAFGSLVLLAWNTPTAGIVLILFLLVAVAVGLIGALARATVSPPAAG